MQPVVCTSCAYHRPALVPLVSLRDFRAPRQRSRLAVAVAERTEAPSGVPPPPAPDLPQLSAQQRQQVTQDVLRAFLETSVPTSQQHSSDSSDGTKQRPRRRRRQRSRSGEGAGPDARGGGGAPQPEQRGLQGAVVAHLLGGDFDEAFLETVPPHTLNWAIQTLGQQGGLLQAEQLFHWMRLKGLASQHTFAKLCAACGAARQPWRALQAWRNTRRMPQAQRTEGPRAAWALVLCYRSTADHRGASAALDELLRRGTPLDRYAFNAAMRVAADAGAANEALCLLGQLRQLASGDAHASGEARRPPGQRAGEARGNGRNQPPREGGSAAGQEMRPDARSYSAVLAALAAAGRHVHAARVHGWMVDDGVAPDPALCTQLLACFAAAGQAERAQRLFDAMLADPELAPNRTHWNALLSAYAQAGDAAGAAAAYRAMLAAGARPDQRTMLALLRAGFHARQGPAAVAAVRREMRAARLPLNLQLATAMLCCLRHVDPAPWALHGLEGAQQGHSQTPPLAADGQQAAAAARRAERSAAAAAAAGGAEGSAAAAAPGAQGSAGATAAADKAAGAAGPAPDLRGACLAEARALFGRMAAHAARAGRPLDLRAYNSLLLVQLAAGDWQGVVDTFRRLEEDEEAPLPDDTTLGAVVAACRAAGWPQLEEQYRRLQQGSRLLDGGGRDGGGRGRRQQRRPPSGGGGA